ncbi:MAG: methyltransferase domain-containing protein [Abitibacteriaceae bacterium]|nr:methyltransferase domain-containing protein [Abditibacteriaceae bacterium]MBV9865785.1 methyltransferase domain-containing protein [Abditibacteriaceae bacterium]
MPSCFFSGCLLLVAGCNLHKTSVHPYPAQTPSTVIYPHRWVAPLFDPEMAASTLDTHERDRWQQPGRIVASLHLKPGNVVADVGAGSGYLMPYLSHAVGPHGIVYAEEIQKGFLPMLHRRARALGNVRIVEGTASDPHLPAHMVDCFVLLTVYHEVQQPIGFLKTLRALTKPGTQLAIIDFDKQRKGYPPAPYGHEVATDAVIAEARAAGWTLSTRYEFIPSQFFLVFRPS